MLRQPAHERAVTQCRGAASRVVHDVVHVLVDAAHRHVPILDRVDEPWGQFVPQVFDRDGQKLSAVSEMMEYIRGQGYVCKEGDGRLIDTGTCCNNKGYCRTINVFMKKNDKNESDDISLDQAREFITQIRGKTLSLFEKTPTLIIQ